MGLDDEFRGPCGSGRLPPHGRRRQYRRRSCRQLYARPSGCDGSRGPTGQGDRWRFVTVVHLFRRAGTSARSRCRRGGRWVCPGGRADGPRSARPARARGGGLAGVGRLQVGCWQDGHFEEQVDAIEQRAGELVAIAGDLVGRAAAAPVRVTVVAAGAGVHGRHQLEAGREFGPACGAGDGDVTALQGFAQGFEDTALELRQFIKEQHAVVGQADFAGARGPASATRAAADAEWCGALMGECPSVRVGSCPLPTARRRFQGLRRHSSGGKQAGQALGEHGLASARRAEEQQGVLPAGGHFQGPAGLGLAFHVGQIGVARGGKRGGPA
jgi:hypothetical protein